MSTATDELRDTYERQGYLVVRGLFTRNEVNALIAHFQKITEGPDIPNHWQPDRSASDPLRRYPRIVHPHKFDAVSKRWMTDPRVWEVVELLFSEPAVAVQSMYYFKPPGAKGQALHQDDFYLQTKPNPCLAAWTAIDPSLPENGGLHVVPLTNDYEVVCPGMARQEESFTKHYVAPPEGKQEIAVKLNPGDTLFFNGCVIHGSKPNTTKNMWRRSFICHYIPRSSKAVAAWFQPALDCEGNEYRFTASPDYVPCGEPFPPFFDAADARKLPSV